VNRSFIIVPGAEHQSSKLARNLNVSLWARGALALSNFPFVADRGSVTDAHELMARFGDDAGFEAAIAAMSPVFANGARSSA
jgi:hypothetical protein